MKTTDNQLGKNYHEELQRNRNWMMFAGLLLAAIGTFIIADVYIPQLPVFYTFLAFMFVSLLMLVHAFKFWYRKPFGLYMHMAMGVLYFFAGLTVWQQRPLFASILLMLMILGLFLMGIFRVMVSTRQGIDYLGWSWTLITGIVDILLASILVLYQHIIASILLIVSAGAIDVIFTGLALFWLGYSYKHALVYPPRE